MFTEFASSIKNSSSLFTPYPPITDRISWEGLSEDLKQRLIDQGESCLARPLPMILASDFMDFCRTGNRDRYQEKLFDRRIMLNALVLAECVENKGRFLDGIVNAVFLICEESAWQLPAHNSYIRDTPQLILPDVCRPIIDLFAAETGAILGIAEYLLREPFEKLSPHISILINENLEHRLLRPYLEEHFWWMGDGVSPMNNWTSWCTQNILLAAFTRPLSPETQAAIFQKACQSLDYFLEEYGTDGCCDEGAQYYRHAGLTLFNSLEVLNGITDNGFSALYQEEKVRNIAAYILNSHVDGEYYVNFADCSPKAGRCNAREYLFGKHTGNPDLMTFAATDYQNSKFPLLPQEHNLFYRLQTIFTHQEMVDHPISSDISHPDIYYPSAGLFIVRDDHLCLAVKSGDNDDSHNHNDTGSFTIYKDGQPLFIDIGVETYTQKTFSPQRYEIWAMQSQYHNLPTFDGIMQMNGSDYKAQNISHILNQDKGEITMDIARAYPSKGIHSYLRTARLDKGHHITITDTYSGTKHPAVLSLITYEKPTLHGSTLSIGTLGTCQITGAATIHTESIPITDPRLKQTWTHDIHRTLVTLKDQTIQLTIS